MAVSMQCVFFSAILFTAQAGYWSSRSGFLSARNPDTYDLDLRKAVQKNLHEVDLLTDVAQNAPSAVAESHKKSHVVESAASSPVANRSGEPIVVTPTEESMAEVRPQSKPRRKKSAEANLIDSLRHMGEKGEEAVVCVTTCRFGETIRHEWHECLEQCVENPLMRSTFLTMLPKENHRAHAAAVEIPEILQERLEHKRQRSAEL
mmetsp:Transcript_119363/g.232260  ORF Transcript_119363/g.232260 Transcript_119363/m.232260 type:complete len:205 (-) Transcript_119363:165-779(-)|eukprot:CAMPEP_0172715770 /NCGR_PEP_ID=MMETSP1074-20121228/67733_1 /TAXON_ID=2916 /ORGANISM="Ceratium fusus, Strain PA161109" /LENGTH=204 /DNA_ID=CAMNT_0013540377 /DNA_START=58 /DNA_END=672 /DNA_ORIENTATION=-